MLCGLTRILLRIKWLIFFSFDKRKRPFETGKCHACLWCKYLDNCMEDYKWFIDNHIDVKKLTNPSVLEITFQAKNIK